MKKFISIICALAMFFAMAGCKKQTDITKNTDIVDYSNTSLIGKVTTIDGTVVTLQLGELTEMDMKMPVGQEPGGGNGQMPAMPSDEGGDGNGEFQQLLPEDSDNTMTELPPGEAGGTPPELPSGEGGGMAMGRSMISFTAGDGTATIDLADATVIIENMDGTSNGSMGDITVDDILVVDVDENNVASTVTIKNIPEMEQQMGQPGNSFGGSAEVTQGTSANTINADGTYMDTTYSSTGDDENALRIDGTTVMLEGITVNKESGATSNTENGDFYGMNAALLVTDGANATMNGITVNSSAQNGNGVFSYGEGTVVNISDSVITTTADNSGGIQTTGGGTTNASNLDVTTSGNSSAAIRSDRGGGTVNADGGTYTSNGYNSPAVYSTAAITVKNATLVANNSEALVIEGKNSMALENCVVHGNMSDTMGTSSDINVHNVMIYQSMSGDADVGTSVFSMTGGSLTSNNGDMFYVTNTHCVMMLSGVEIINNEADGYFLLVSGNDASRGWGNAGANGAQVEFTTDGQVIEGDIAVDSISTLTIELTNGSIFNGTLNIIDNEQNGAVVDNNAVVTIDSDCTWNLTGDCAVTSLANYGTINFNGYTITLADGTVLSD
ncbi:MAG: hypothetical protein K2G45_00555 [Lachnospiraceae bacterium]|nr:hypothetical protein [Lachnospiraceae bacterium]